MPAHDAFQRYEWQQGIEIIDRALASLGFGKAQATHAVETLSALPDAPPIVCVWAGLEPIEANCGPPTD